MNTCLPKLHLWDFFSWALRLLTGSDAFCVGLLVGFLWCHVFVFVWQPWVFFLVLFRESRAALHCLPLNFKLHEYLVIGEAVYFCRDKNYKRSLHELYLLILAIHCVALIFLLKIYFVSCHERCSHSGSVGLFFFLIAESLPAMQETGLGPWVGELLGEGNGSPRQYSLHRQRVLVGYSPWGHKESDTTERLTDTHTLHFILIPKTLFKNKLRWFLCNSCVEW